MLSFVSAPYSGYEGTVLQFIVTRQNGASGAIAVDWVISDGEGQPTPASGTVTWNTAEAGAKSVAVVLGLVAANRVRAITLSNPRSLSGGSTPTISDGTAALQILNDASAPANVTLSATAVSSSTINLSAGGGADAGSGFKEYVFERSLDGASGWTEIARQGNGSYSDTGRSSATLYYYRVVAVDVAGNSSSIATANAQTQGGGTGFADGDEIEIVGSGFGSNEVSQEFLGGVNGPIETAANGASWNSVARPGWLFPGNSPSRISTTRSLNGAKSLANLNYGPSNYQYGVAFDTGAQYRAIYTRLAYYFSNPTNELKGQLKLDRYVGVHASNDLISDINQPNTYYTRYWQGAGSYIAVNGGSSATIYPDQGGGVDGHWMEMNGWYTKEVVFMPDSAAGAGNGSMQWRVVRNATGQVVTAGTVSNRNFWGAGLGAFRYWVLQGYIGNEFASSLDEVYWDRDVYCAWNVAGSAVPKTVLMGNASTYDACTVFTVCRWTSWADTRIRAQANKGAHATLAGKYFYVMAGINNPVNSTGLVGVRV